jgi:molecular chaperone DnaK (HSP70)
MTKDEQRYELMKKFVAYMAERNEFDPFLYNTAERRIREDGAVYWDNELRSVPELYQACKAFTTQQAQFLERKFEVLNTLHTCLPTRRSHEINEAMHKAWLADYWTSVERGWSTE